MEYIGFLRLTILCGRTLKGDSLDNCYCVVSLTDGGNTYIKNTKHKTALLKHKSTEWNETFDFPLDQHCSFLQIKVKHRGTLGRSRLGHALTSLQQFTDLSNASNDLWITFRHKDRDVGSILVRYAFSVSAPSSLTSSWLSRGINNVASPLGASTSSASSSTMGSRTTSTRSIQHSHSKRDQFKQERRTRKLRKLFNLSPEERVVDRFGCALESKMAFQGYLYMTGHYLFFYSKGHKIFFKLHEITDIEDRPSLIVQNPVRFIIANGREEYTFGNFKKKDVVLEIIKRQREAAIQDVQMNPPVDHVEPTANDEATASFSEISETEPDDVADFSETDHNTSMTGGVVFVEQHPVRNLNENFSASTGSVVSMIELPHVQQTPIPGTTIGLQQPTIQASHPYAVASQNVILDHPSVSPVYVDTVPQSGPPTVVIPGTQHQDGHAPHDEERELNLSPKESHGLRQRNLSSVENQGNLPLRTSQNSYNASNSSLANSGRSTLINSNNGSSIRSSNNSVVPNLARQPTDISVNSSTLSSTSSSSTLPSNNNINNATSIEKSATIPTSPKIEQLNAIQKTSSINQKLIIAQPQILLMHYMALSVFLSLLFLTSGNDLVATIWVSTLMGISMSVLQPGLTSQALFSLVLSSESSKQKLGSPVAVLAVKWVFAAIVTLPLLILVAGFTPKFYVGWFSSFIVAVLLGGSSIAAEMYLGLIQSSNIPSSPFSPLPSTETKRDK